MIKYQEYLGKMSDDIILDAFTKAKGIEGITPQGDLLSKILQGTNGFSGDNIDSFNEWVMDLISHIDARVIKTNVNVNGTIYPVVMMFRDCKYIKPEHSSGGRMVPTYPQHCRINNTTYEFTICATPYLYFLSRSMRGNDVSAIQSMKVGEPLIGNIMEIAKVPAMLGSMVCNLHGITDPAVLEAYGVEPEDPLGYFISQGTDKCMLSIQKLRLNRIYVFPQEIKTPTHCRIIVPTAAGTKQMQLVISKEGSVLLQLGAFKPKGTAAASKSQGANVFHVVNLFTKMFPLEGSLKDISVIELFKTLVLSFTKSSAQNKVYNKLLISEAHFIGTGSTTSIQNSIDIFASLMGLVGAKVVPSPGVANQTQEIAIRIYEMFNDSFFPNVTSIHGSNISYIKLCNLAIMTARLLEYLVGAREPDDKDSWANNKLDSPGKSTAVMFRRVFAKTMGSVQKVIDGEKGNKVKKNGDTVIHSSPTEIFNIFISTCASSFSEMTKEIAKAFSSNKWGEKNGFARNNLTDALESVNPVDIVSNVTKIDVKAIRRTKSIKIRGVKKNQCGYICPAGALDDTDCGIIKWKGSTCIVTIDVNPSLMVQVIMSTEYVSSNKSETHSSYLMVNGVFLGWATADILYEFCVHMRRNGTFHKHSEFVKNNDGSFEIFTDGGRLVRPLLVVNKDPNNVEREIAKIELDGAWELPLDELFSRGYIEYIGSAEQERLSIAHSRPVLQKRIDDVKEKIQDYNDILAMYEEDRDPETQEAVVTAFKRYTQAYLPYHYMEIHPVAILSPAAGIINFVNLNFGPRISYETKMKRQIIPPRLTNPAIHKTGTLFRPTAYQPLISTVLDSAVGIDKRSMGVNVIMAISTYSGFAQEDALVVDQALIDSGKLDYVKYIVRHTKIVTVGDPAERLTKPEYKPENSSYNRFHAIGDNGLPVLGSYLNEGDAFIVKTKEVVRDGIKTWVPSSEYLTVGEYGIVDDVRVVKSATELDISVRLRCYRRPTIGDKFFFSPSQKDTIGIILPSEDMPYDPITGMRPNVIMNPHAIPSRMTMGLLKEMLYGTALVRTGKKYDATGFQYYDDRAFQDMILIDRDENMYNYLVKKRELLDEYDDIVLYRLPKTEDDARKWEEFMSKPIPQVWVDEIESERRRSLLIEDAIESLDDLDEEDISEIDPYGTVVPREKKALMTEGLNYQKDLTPIPTDLKEGDPITPAIRTLIEKIITRRDQIEKEIRGIQLTYQSGKVRMVNGITGEVMLQPMYMGPVRMYPMTHIADYKKGARSRGAVDPLTRQPIKGKSHHGAIKFSTMDYNALMSHGAAHAIEERMCGLSDKYGAAYCTRCGVIADMNNIVTPPRYECPMCKDPNAPIGSATLPYVFKYLTQILASLNMVTKVKVVEQSKYVDTILASRKVRQEAVVKDELSDEEEEGDEASGKEEEGEVGIGGEADEYENDEPPEMNFSDEELFDL